MAQHLFQSRLQKAVKPSDPFLFNRTETGNFCNVIRIRSKTDLLRGDLKNLDRNIVDTRSVAVLNNFIHTPFKLIGSILTGEDAIGSVGVERDPTKEKEMADNFIPLGTKIVDTIHNSDPDITDNNGRSDSQIDIVLSKSVNSEIESGGFFIFCIQEFFNKTKKSVIGLDANVPQKLNSLVPLFATDGTPLVDDFGNQLVAETEIALVETIQAANSTLVNLTKRPKTSKSTGSIKVEEIFPTVSEVSNTLLGIPRAETQLSLFSDVSTNGLDEENWEVFKALETNRIRNVDWETRKTKDSQRYNAKLVENTLEQALELTAYPVPYTYPFDKRSQFFRATEHAKFVRWVLLGNFMYRYYEEREDPIKDDFLNPSICTVEEVTIASEADDEDPLGDILKFSGSDSNNDSTFASGQAAAFRAIDIWTETFIKLKNGNYNNTTLLAIFTILYNDQTFDRINTYLEAFTNIGEKLLPSGVNDEVTLLRRGVTTYYLPGYEWEEDDKGEEIILRTKETYRYQPGRISGFTFGTRADIVSADGGTQVEWGVENDTDAYLFRLSGGSLSIVRKSTVPLSNQFLVDERLVGRQVFKSGEKNRFTGAITPDFYELQIGQREWNVDTLDGNGPSGFSIDARNVTMWKIEFSWYGAIGARFYAYIPVDNGEARWVLAHTIVIENKLIKACLEDPFFRMKYAFRLKNRENSNKPQFVYKYGSSVYIDGGDEGTKRQFSYTGDKKTSVYDTFVPLLGIKAKREIKNREGVARLNRRIVFPELINVNATEFTQFEMIECEACPGFGFTYDDGLFCNTPQNASTIKKINFHTFTLGGGLGSSGTQYIRLSDYDKFDTLHQESPDQFANVGFTPDDDDAQIIIPGMSKRYINYVQTVEDFSNASVSNKEEFLFEDTDLRSPTGLVDTSTKTINSSNTERSFDIDSSVLNAFDIPVGAAVQVKINFANSPIYDEFDVYLESGTEVTSAKVAHTGDDSGEYTFRLIASKEGTTKITVNALSGDGGGHNSPNDVVTTDVNITGIRICEFKMSRVKSKDLDTNTSFFEGLLREGIVENPALTPDKFLGGDSYLKIGDVDADTSALTFEASSLTNIEERVRDIVQYEKGKATFRAEDESPNRDDELTLDILNSLDSIFEVIKNRIYIKRNYFDGDYSDGFDSPLDSPLDSPDPSFTPVKEYTWFIGNKATLSPINKNFASSSILIESEDAEIRFLNPVNNVNAQDRTTGQRLNNSANFLTGKHTTEFRIAFTNVNPANGKTPREKDLLFVDFDRPKKNTDRIAKAEVLSGDGDGFQGVDNIVDTFQLDYRIKNVPHEGSFKNGGVCSKVKIGAAAREDFLINIGYYATKAAFLADSQFNDFDDILEADGVTEKYPTSIFDDLGDKLLVISSSLFLDKVFDRANNFERKITFNGGELGINSTGTGVNFASEPIFFQYQNDDGQTAEACVVQLSATPSPAISPTDNITLSFVRMEYTYASSGAIFVSKDKVFGFDPFPLYPLFFTRYGARINNINFKNGNVVSSPTLTTYGDDISITQPLSDTDPGYIDHANAPLNNSENFIEQDQLSGLLVDKSTNKRLRKTFTPGDPLFGLSFNDGTLAGRIGSTNSSTRVRRLTTLYAGGGDVTFDSQKVDLTDIFKEDRFKIQPDFRDAKAIFVVGKQPTEDSPEGSNDGTFQASINTSEV